MKCKNPYVRAGMAHPCGQCLPCRFNARRVWTHRIMLEAGQYSDNAYVTLTYRPPLYGPEDMSLRPRDLQLFLKRLRFRIAPHRIRFYAVGEYGDLNHRPHFHLALFNYPTCFHVADRLRFGKHRYARGFKNCCTPCDTLRDLWPYGFVDVGTLEVDSAQYIAGYVTKKMTLKSDPRLCGRHPEFARMSNRPGIGASAMHDVASELLKFNLDASQTDVPSVLRHGSRLLPLGRYLRQKLRLYVGKDGGAPAEVLAQMEEELRPLREASFYASRSFKEVIIESSVQEHRNFDAKSKLFQKGKKL